MFTFDQAIQRERALKSNALPSLLLGNGFSRSYSDDFAYAKLRDMAEFQGLSVDRASLFNASGSDDFETVMNVLLQSRAILELYSDQMSEVRDRMWSDCDELRQGLVAAITQVHPRGWETVRATRTACAFLGNFGQVYTLNYDFLLYWAINSCGDFPVPREDGFKKVGDCLGWSAVHSANYQQRVFWLHGGFHLYTEGEYVRKLRRGSQGGLLEQVTKNLEEGRYPLVVTEGTSEGKERRIASSDYLTFCHERLGDSAGALFVHGVSMAKTDEHVMRRIYSRPSRIRRLYVGVFNPESDSARDLMERARALSRQRAEQGGDSLEVEFYDAATAQIWEAVEAA